MALALGACTNDPGGTSPTDPTAPTSTIPVTTTTTLGSREGLERFETCLVENGLELEPISLDAQGRPRLDLLVPDVDFTDEDSVAAWAGCSRNLATGALDLSGNPVLMDRVVGLLESFSECLRSHGVPDFPDPIDGFSGIGGPYPLAEIPYADPDLGHALTACRIRVTAGDD